MRKSKAYREKEAVYDAAKPKRNGNLHERVKFLSILASDVYEKHSAILHANPLLEKMRQAIFDVQCEAALNDCDPISRAAGERKEFSVQSETSL